MSDRTLLWIGPRSTPEFSSAYRVCEQAAAQVAYRANMDQAFRRPASQVATIVVAEPDSKSLNLDTDALERLKADHPAARVLRIQGALRSSHPGNRLSHREGVCDWHQAADRLSHWLGYRPEHRPRPRVVAVMCCHQPTTEMLMELIQDSGVSAIAARNASSLLARHVDCFWWDDSVADHRTTSRWRRQLQAVQPCASPHARHVWMSGLPTTTGIAAAQNAGIDDVLSKPIEYAALRATLECFETPGEEILATGETGSSGPQCLPVAA